MTEDEKKRQRIHHAMVVAKDQALAIEARYYEALVEKPLLCVPPRLRPAMLQVWACHRHLPGLDTALSLACSVGTWISQFGLDEGDAILILRKMVHPAFMARHQRASDLISDLGRLAVEAIKNKRDRLEREKREANAAAAEKAKPETLEKLSEMLGTMFQEGKPK